MLLFLKEEPGIKLRDPKASPSAVFPPVPEFHHLMKCHVVEFMSAAEENKKKCDPILLLEILHEFHLMFMYILKRKCI